MSEEVSKLVIASGDRIMSRALGDEGTPTTDAWQVSSPIPGARIINTWQIYNNIWLALTVTENGHYCIYRTINLQKYILVHDHATRIFNIFYVDDGHVLFSADDGWWATTDNRPKLVWTIAGNHTLCKGDCRHRVGRELMGPDSLWAGS